MRQERRIPAAMGGLGGVDAPDDYQEDEEEEKTYCGLVFVIFFVLRPGEAGLWRGVLARY